MQIILNTAMPLWVDFKAFLQTALPLLVQASIVYLIIRFALVVSSVVVRLSQINLPARDPKESLDPEDAMDAELAGEGQEGKAPGDASPALPERTPDR